MKYLTLLLLVIPMSVSGHTDESLEKLLDAIRIVETGGQPNGGKNSWGDNGRSYGPLQISKAYFSDAQKQDSSLRAYKYSDLSDYDLSCRVVRAYWRKYATERRIGRPVTDEDRARIHNGGLNGYKKKATEKYWKKVKACLKK